jgi:hypothetical protein
MSTTLVNADLILALDIGTISTRAILFDVVEGRYRFLGAGTIPTTANAPIGDISEGVRLALDQLQDITGRSLIGPDGQLAIPALPDGTGVDACVATISVGPPIRVVAIGLLENISAESARNLATTTYAEVIETLSLNDRRKTAARLDTLLSLRPDLVVIAGGAEGGASESVIDLLEAVGLACYVLPKEQRPEVLYAGNSALVKTVRDHLGGLASLHIAPNVRPSLDIEQLTPSQSAFSQVFRQVRARQMRGVAEIDRWTGNRLTPSATAFGRTIRFISKEYAHTRKGVLGIDVGASSTTVAAGLAGELIPSVYTQLGLGQNLPQMLNLCSLDDIQRWLTVEISNQELQDYIYNKAAFPNSLPAGPVELAIEQALACQAVNLAVRQAMQTYPAELPRTSPDFLPWFEPIIATGSVFTRAPSRAQALLMLLNALQPTGITTLALDRNNLAGVLGAAAAVAPLLTIQSLDSTNFLNLCTVISPVGHAPMGAPVLRIRLSVGENHEANLEVKNGSLEVIKLPAGQTGTLYLTPLHRFDVGLGGAGRGGSLKVIGGALGVVIDARGRPLRLSADPRRRREQHKKWLATLEN